MAYTSFGASGSVPAIVTNAGDLDLEVYAGEVMAAYQFQDFFGTNGMRYFGMKPTEKINLPIISEKNNGAKGLADGADHAPDDAQIGALEIPLWTLPVKSGDLVKRSDVDVRPDLNVLQTLGAQHGRNVGKGKTIRYLNCLASAAATASNFKVQDYTTSVGAENVRQGVEDIMAAMDALGIDPVGRYGMLKPAPYYKLAQVESVIRGDWGGAQNIKNIGGNGQVLNYLNCNIKNCGLGLGTDWTNSTYNTMFGASDTALVRADMATKDVYGVFWHQDSWAMREQVRPENSLEWLAEKQSWLVLSRWHAGYATLQSGGIWVLRKTA